MLNFAGVDRKWMNFLHFQVLRMFRAREKVQNVQKLQVVQPKYTVS
jgi:hypothetical protein